MKLFPNAGFVESLILQDETVDVGVPVTVVAQEIYGTLIKISRLKCIIRKEIITTIIEWNA
jgi:hypothetical protein